MSNNNLSLLIVFLFIMVPLILAELARKKAFPTAEDFFLQSRTMSTVMTFFTVYATWMSIFAFLGATTYFYESGPIYMTAIAWDAFFGVGFFYIGRKMWFYGKQNKYITPANFFNDIYGSKVLSLLVVIVLIVFTFPYLQIQLSGGAYLIEIATQGVIPWRVSGMLFYAIIVIYLWAGGLRAVAMADVFYAICLFSAMVYIGFYLAHEAGGIGYVFQEISKINIKNITLPGPTGDAGPILWICLFISVPLGVLMGPQMWIRAYAVKNEKTFNIIPLLITIMAIQCIGPMLAGSAGILLEPGLEQADKLIPILLIRTGDMFFAMMLFCGIAAAALSSANAVIHALATIYTIDIHRRYINEKATDKQLFNIAKMAVVIISAVAYGVLLKDPSIIMETGVLGFGGVSQIAVATVGAFSWKRSNSKAAICGIVCGVTAIVFLNFVIGLNTGYSAVLALILNALVFIILSLLLKSEKEVEAKIVLYRETFRNRG